MNYYYWAYTVSAGFETEYKPDVVVSTNTGSYLTSVK